MVSLNKAIAGFLERFQQLVNEFKNIGTAVMHNRKMLDKKQSRFLDEISA